MTHTYNQWNKILQDEYAKEYFTSLEKFLDFEYNNHKIYPPKDDIFNALKYTDFNDVKAVIIGQDPYHGEGQAHGLSFSVREGVKLPPSLRNIFKELESELGISIPISGDLTRWATGGVLLLNSVLTVREGCPNSHKSRGWEQFTDSIIKKLNEREKPIAFILWGANARAKSCLITNPQHCIFESAHPSPLSAYHGFFGCGHFSKVNEFLLENNIDPINW